MGINKKNNVWHVDWLGRIAVVSKSFRDIMFLIGSKVIVFYFKTFGASHTYTNGVWCTYSFCKVQNKYV